MKVDLLEIALHCERAIINLAWVWWGKNSNFTGIKYDFKVNNSWSWTIWNILLLYKITALTSVHGFHNILEAMHLNLVRFINKTKWKCYDVGGSLQISVDTKSWLACTQFKKVTSCSQFLYFSSFIMAHIENYVGTNVGLLLESLTSRLALYSYSYWYSMVRVIFYDVYLYYDL